MANRTNFPQGKSQVCFGLSLQKIDNKYSSRGLMAEEISDSESVDLGIPLPSLSTTKYATYLKEDLPIEESKLTANAKTLAHALAMPYTKRGLNDGDFEFIQGFQRFKIPIQHVRKDRSFSLEYEHNVGWSIFRLYCSRNTKQTVQTERFACNGALVCPNEKCTVGGIRPAYEKSVTEKWMAAGCNLCKAKLQYIPCDVVLWWRVTRKENEYECEFIQSGKLFASLYLAHHYIILHNTKDITTTLSIHR
jgi:hypothetical protein